LASYEADCLRAMHIWNIVPCDAGLKEPLYVSDVEGDSGGY